MKRPVSIVGLSSGTVGTVRDELFVGLQISIRRTSELARPLRARPAKGVVKLIRSVVDSGDTQIRSSQH